MDLIDRLHRVPLVRKALGLRGRMNLVALAICGNRPVAGRSVMDEDGSRRNVLGIDHQRLLRGRLPHPAEEDGASFAIGHRADAELVPGKPAHRVAVCVLLMSIEFSPIRVVEFSPIGIPDHSPFFLSSLTPRGSAVAVRSLVL